MAAITLNLGEAARRDRVVLVILLQHNLSLVENWQALQRKAWGRAFDLETTLILIAIVAIGAEGLRLTDLEGRYQSLETPIDLEMLRVCNISSIAATTLINRETVRRRVKQLEAASLVERDSRGSLRIATGVLQRSEVREGVLDQLRLMKRTVNDLVGAGALSVSASGAG